MEDINRKLNDSLYRWMKLHDLTPEDDIIILVRAIIADIALGSPDTTKNHPELKP